MRRRVKLQIVIWSSSSQEEEKGSNNGANYMIRILYLVSDSE